MIVCDKCGAGIRSENRFELHLASKENCKESKALIAADYCDKCANYVRGKLADVIREARGKPFLDNGIKPIVGERPTAPIVPPGVTVADLLAQLVDENKV